MITPYNAQRHHLLRYVMSSGHIKNMVYSDLEISNIDAFQGRENVIMSCVRSNDARAIGFLNDWKRMNDSDEINAFINKKH